MCVALACLARMCVCIFPRVVGGKSTKTESSHKEIFASSDTQLHILNNFFNHTDPAFQDAVETSRLPLAEEVDVAASIFF